MGKKKGDREWEFFQQHINSFDLTQARWWEHNYKPGCQEEGYVSPDGYWWLACRRGRGARATEEEKRVVMDIMRLRKGA